MICRRVSSLCASVLIVEPDEGARIAARVKAKPTDTVFFRRSRMRLSVEILRSEASAVREVVRIYGREHTLFGAYAAKLARKGVVGHLVLRRESVAVPIRALRAVVSGLSARRYHGLAIHLPQPS